LFCQFQTMLGVAYVFFTLVVGWKSHRESLKNRSFSHLKS
jgi:hypothetical protein